MKFNQLIKPLFIMLLLLGLVAGCASTPDDTSEVDQATAEQAIADAKSSNAQAQKMGAEWRDTGDMIASAEEALAAGDYAKAVELANAAQRQAENAMQQARDQQAKLSESTVEADEDTSAPMSGGDDSYSVMRGDNLWSISGQGSIYANPYQWPMIYKANRNKIKDADLIYPGQVFDIERGASGADVDAAIQHAKTRGAWSVGRVEASDEAYLAQ